MIAISLQSGSNGNCVYVETDGVRLLFDAGISGIQASQRLAACGRNIRDVDALIISHDHADHVRYVGVYQRKFGLPVYITPKTLESSSSVHDLGRLHSINHFRPGEEIQFGRVSVQTIPCPHDAVDGAVFVITSYGKKLGILTDLGHAFHELFSVMPTLDAVFIESNYDPDMLSNGPYPAFLKRRIRGPQGHLSNLESAELLRSGNRLRWACLSHLSNNNNDPAVALRTHREVLGNDFPLHTASRFAATEILKV